MKLYERSTYYRWIWWQLTLLHSTRYNLSITTPIRWILHIWKYNIKKEISSWFHIYTLKTPLAIHTYTHGRQIIKWERKRSFYRILDQFWLRLGHFNLYHHLMAFLKTIGDYFQKNYINLILILIRKPQNSKVLLEGKTIFTYLFFN